MLIRKFLLLIAWRCLGEVSRDWKTTAVANITKGKLDLRHFVWEGKGSVSIA